jgi:hypothetical protein
MTARRAVGWIATALSVLAASFWAVWGSIETFYEGWWYRDWKMNVAMSLVQYLSPMVVIVLAALAAIRWPRVGSVLHVAGAVLVVWFLGVGGPALTIVVPLVLLAALYRFGRPDPRRWAFRLAGGVPIATALVCGVYPAWLVSQRVDDGDYGARLIAGNGVRCCGRRKGPAGQLAARRGPALRARART